MLEAAFVAGLASEGVVVHRLGVVPTPAVAFEASRRNAIGAVISASHNPYRDNGIKLFASGGIKLPDEVEERIEHDVGALPPPTGEPAQLLDAEETPDYLDHLVGALDGRDLDGLRIVVDSANGASQRHRSASLRRGRRRRRGDPQHAGRSQHQRPVRRNAPRLSRRHRAPRGR